MRGSFLPFHRPSIGEEEIQEVGETLASGWLTTGPRVKQFEAAFARFVGASHAVALNSGTAALHLALAAIGLRPGDEVIVPSMTFTATAAVVAYFGARPVLVDCRRDTFNLDERALDENVTPRTKAIIPVHMAGQACEMDAILEVAQRHGLKVIEDAAHALPARYKGRMIGTLGDIATFSFYATKTITTGEGGMAVTDHKEYAEHIERLSLHGMSADMFKRSRTKSSWYYEVLELGYKYNMTDIAAALGIHQLRKADAFLARRQQIARRYTQAFSQTEALRAPAVLAHTQHAWHLYVLLLNLEMLTIDRDEFIVGLHRRNIGTSVHFIPLHLHPYYQDTFRYRPGDFPNAEWVYRRCISLPIYPAMTDEDVDSVVEAVDSVITSFKR